MIWAGVYHFIKDWLSPRHDGCDDLAHGEIIHIPSFALPSLNATDAAESVPLLGGVTFSYAHAIGCECADCWQLVPSFHTPESK